jgi:cob(I)alamin adenosyltransferase
MSKLFTRSGDDGTSGILGEGKVSKDHPRLEAVGSIDEANSVFGILRATCDHPKICETVLSIQRDLYLLMAEVAATPENAHQFRAIDDNKVRWLESRILALNPDIQIPKEFIIPGDTLTGAYLDLARTVVRRAERRIIKLFHRGEIENQFILKYLNRLSSLCFALILWENKTQGKGSYAKE